MRGTTKQLAALATMVVACCMLYVGCYAVQATNMATQALTKATKVTTTPAALAPSNAPAAVLAPSTQPMASFTIAGKPSTAKQATNGVGPAPKPGTVGHAALACIAAGNATLTSVQAAVTAVGLRGKHPALALLRWLAANRGYTFVVHNGTVKLG